MLFKQVLVDAILDGRKTQTRRPVKPGETECRYKPNRAYAVQPGRGKPGVARILVTGVRRERLGAITEEDAVKEGFGPPPESITRWSARDEFINYWLHLYGQDADFDAEVWVIEFKLLLEGSKHGGA